MIFPLKNWAKLPYGYKFGKPTWYNRFHIGVDKIAPKGTPVYAHDRGVAKKVYTPIQGNAIHIIDSEGHLCRYLHLSKVYKVGAVKQGDLIGYVGSTGLSSANHLHFDVSKGKVYVDNPANFLDPEKYILSNGNPPVKKVYGLVTKKEAACRAGASRKYKINAIYKRGQKFQILGVAKGENVAGITKWYRTPKGYVWSFGIKITK